MQSQTLKNATTGRHQQRWGQQSPAVGLLVDILAQGEHSHPCSLSLRVSGTHHIPPRTQTQTCCHLLGLGFMQVQTGVQATPQARHHFRETLENFQPVGM